MQNNFLKVQWLTVKELAEMWAPELGMPTSVVKRELLYGLYKVEKAIEFAKPLNEPVPEDELPTDETLIQKDFMEKFCRESVELQMPKFWFGGFDKGPQEPAFPGRPSLMRAILKELEAQADREELVDNLAEQSRQLSKWAEEKFSGQQTPKPKSVENGIRVAFRILKNNAPKPH